MLRNSTSRIVAKIPMKQVASSWLFADKLYSTKSNETRVESMFNEQQAPYYTAKDVEFCPNRAKEVMQNNVEGAASNAVNEDAIPDEKTMNATSGDQEHMEAYQANNSVSLHSVMQSNVPEPFNTSDKAPTHLNMPGSSSSRDYKYLSDKMQNAHHSRQ